LGGGDFRFHDGDEKEVSKNAEPQVTISVAQLHLGWLIPASFLNFPEESFALSSFRQVFLPSMFTGLLTPTS